MTDYWIPGWQFGVDSFQSLYSCLPETEMLSLEYAQFNGSLEQWLDTQSALLPADSVLTGWSLGGMLACALAARSPQVKAVRVLAANTRFAGGPGLESAVAEDFRRRYQRNAELTRRRFAQLVDAERPETVAALLLPDDQLATLHWLYELDLTDSRIHCPLSVLLAEDDRLVPVTAAEASWRALGADVTRIDGQHSLPVSQPETVAQWLLQTEVAHG